MIWMDTIMRSLFTHDGGSSEVGCLSRRSLERSERRSRTITTQMSHFDKLSVTSFYKKRAKIDGRQAATNSFY